MSNHAYKIGDWVYITRSITLAMFDWQRRPQNLMRVQITHLLDEEFGETKRGVTEIGYRARSAASPLNQYRFQEKIVVGPVPPDKIPKVVK